jgi:hypothetical protein
MQPPARRFHLVVLFVLVATSTLVAEPLERSVSPSRQFIIFGTNAPIRGAISHLAEQTKSNLLALVQQHDNWKTPIVINLQLPQANIPEIPKSALYFSQTGAGLKLQLDLVIGDDMNALDLRRDLLRAILLEMIYRGQRDVAPGTFYVQPPDWLLDGLLVAAPGGERATLAESVAPLLSANKLMALEEFLRQRPQQLDAPARLLYRACALALLELLSDGPQGHARLARYIETLSNASNDPLADLKTQFPVLSGKEDVWRSNVARLAAGQRYRLLAFAETETKLEELLRINIGPGSTGMMRLDDLPSAKLSPAEKAQLSRVSTNLQLLGPSANPVLRPVVQEYQAITQLLVAGKHAGLSKRLAKLKATRSRLAARMNDIDDYMNWFEATQSATKSGAFGGYLQSAAEKRAPDRRRRDALSVYLDALEEQFKN